MYIVIVYNLSFTFTVMWLSFCLSPYYRVFIPVYSNSGVTIKGPCPSSQDITPVGSTKVKFECFLNHSGGYLMFWNVTGFSLVIYSNAIPNGIDLDVPSGGTSGITSVTIENIGSQKLTKIQCGLCNNNKVECIQSPLQPTVISIPVQLISFGK